MCWAKNIRMNAKTSRFILTEQIDLFWFGRSLTYFPSKTGTDLFSAVFRHLGSSELFGF